MMQWKRERRGARVGYLAAVDSNLFAVVQKDSAWKLRAYLGSERIERTGFPSLGSAQRFADTLQTITKRTPQVSASQATKLADELLNAKYTIEWDGIPSRIVKVHPNEDPDSFPGEIYPDFESAAKALIAYLRGERDDYDDAIRRVSGFTPFDADDVAD